MREYDVVKHAIGAKEWTVNHVYVKGYSLHIPATLARWSREEMAETRAQLAHYQAWAWGLELQDREE